MTLKERYRKRLDVLTEPKHLVSIHKWLTICWFIAAFPICIFLANSIPLLVFVSVYANVAGHWASWQAARTEVMQEKAEKKDSAKED